MLKSLTAALKLSEISEKLNDLNAVTDPTEAQQTEERELLASQKTTAGEYRSALTNEADTTTTPDDAETRERMQLVSRASLGAIFARAVEHRATDGAESELQAALDLAPNQVPVDLLRAPVEHRAITPAPTHVGASEQPVLMPIFADGDAAFLGVDQVTVPAGDVVVSRPDESADRGRSARRFHRGRRDDRRVYRGAGQAGTVAGGIHVPARRRGAVFGHGRFVAASAERIAQRIARRADRVGRERAPGESRRARTSGGRHVRDVCRQVWILPRRWPVRVEREIRQGADGLGRRMRTRAASTAATRVKSQRHRSADDDHGWRAGVGTRPGGRVHQATEPS